MYDLMYCYVFENYEYKLKLIVGVFSDFFCRIKFSKYCISIHVNLKMRSQFLLLSKGFFVGLNSPLCNFICGPVFQGSSSI